MTTAPQIQPDRDAAYWRNRFHLMRREVRRLNKTINLFSKVMQLQTETNIRLRDQLHEKVKS